MGAVGLAATVTSAAPSQAQTTGEVFTSDFETGTTEDWISRGSAELEATTTRAHSGDYSLLTTGRTAGWHGPAYNLEDILEPRAQYRFEVSVRLADGEAEAPIALTMQSTPESTGETTWNQVASAASVTDTEWVTVSGEYTPPEPAFEMQFYVESGSETAAYHIDDVAVTMIQPPPDIDLPPEAAATVDFGDDRQRIDGFGFSQAFQRAAVMNGLNGLTPEHRQEVLDLLLDPETGAGFSILRLGIGSSSEDPYDLMKSIQPEDPGGPDAEPQYVWDGYDGGQVWLAQQAQEYGVDRFYADAWSAPGYMKTNGDDAGGGELCGLPGTDCDADWRQAYADYLIRYAEFYEQEGIEITDIGFTNEPDYTTSYASMRFDYEQINDFVQVMGPTIAESGIDADLVCCDSFGWDEQTGYTEAIEADPEAAQWVDIHAGHSYASASNHPLPTEATTWMSEYALSASEEFNPAWDAGGGNSGLALANHIHDTVAMGEVNAYISWFGASLNNTAAPIQLDGADYNVSKRLWATAAYSRFVRPEAHRVDAGTDGTLLKISAYRNADGSRVVNLINNRDSRAEVDLDLEGVKPGTCIATYVTDEDHSLEEVDDSRFNRSGTTVELPARSLVTLEIAASPRCGGIHGR
ncbi:carbohydrate binding domain-containing protein [Glycomyces xiaoerkulensis]|uniref:carbohydrate binding domain-containing protein n=1 Tax=Glycomyces xiaoerkulensis TaxID=2038139 RepID=UPI0018E45813|nr:carbohydrate binding domain-containing protein [Glycomyces xiaoerkulensis]